MSWVLTLQKLQKCSILTPTELIKRWNDTASKDEKIVGSKQVALKSILDLPQHVLTPILDCVSSLGWENSGDRKTRRTSRRLCRQRFPSWSGYALLRHM